MTNKKLVGLRLTDEKINSLKNQAEAEHRSVNNLLEVIIDKYLKEVESEQKH